MRVSMDAYVYICDSVKRGRGEKKRQACRSGAREDGWRARLQLDSTASDATDRTRDPPSDASAGSRYDLR